MGLQLPSRIGYILSFIRFSLSVSFLDYYDSPWVHQSVHRWRTVGRNRRHNRLNSCFSSSWSGRKIQCVSLVMQFFSSVGFSLSFRGRHIHREREREQKRNIKIYVWTVYKYSEKHITITLMKKPIWKLRKRQRDHLALALFLYFSRKHTHTHPCF